MNAVFCKQFEWMHSEGFCLSFSATQNLRENNCEHPLPRVL